jgi:hypothetical protein
MTKWQLEKLEQLKNGENPSPPKPPISPDQILPFNLESTRRHEQYQAELKRRVSEEEEQQKRKTQFKARAVPTVVYEPNLVIKSSPSPDRAGTSPASRVKPTPENIRTGGAARDGHASSNVSKSAPGRRLETAATTPDGLERSGVVKRTPDPVSVNPQHSSSAGRPNPGTNKLEDTIVFEAMGPDAVPLDITVQRSRSGESHEDEYVLFEG